MLCFMKSAMQRFLSYTLISDTNAHAFRGRPTLNDVERFGMGRSTNSLAEKPGKCAKFIMSSSHEITNDPYASSNFEILARL